MKCLHVGRCGRAVSMTAKQAVEPGFVSLWRCLQFLRLNFYFNIAIKIVTSYEKYSHGKSGPSEKIKNKRKRIWENDDVIWQNLARKKLALMKNYEGNMSYKLQIKSEWPKWKIENANVFCKTFRKNELRSFFLHFGHKCFAWISFCQIAFFLLLVSANEGHFHGLSCFRYT